MDVDPLLPSRFQLRDRVLVGPTDRDPLPWAGTVVGIGFFLDGGIGYLVKGRAVAGEHWLEGRHLNYDNRPESYWAENRRAFTETGDLRPAYAPIGEKEFGL